jgi:soluble lytic murein transglycosylase
LIRQESEFNPKAISRAKAYGLTQVLPSTGRQISRRAGVTGFSTAMLLQPEPNLKLGSFYLKGLLDQHDGRWERTLASYNAGKSRSDLWSTWGEYREPAEFIESVPFTETRNYIQIVLRNAEVYRRLYGGSTGR